jgi:hypothetical protein
VWGIVLNILLQDAPFLGFRLLLIVHYRIISYMNVFFTCKNTLVIVLQLYRSALNYRDDNSLRCNVCLRVISMSSETRLTSDQEWAIMFNRRPDGAISKRIWVRGPCEKNTVFKKLVRSYQLFVLIDHDL